MDENREAYLRELSEEYGVDYSVVEALAKALGEDEDYDGLITELETGMYY